MLTEMEEILDETLNEIPTDEIGHDDIDGGLEFHDFSVGMTNSTPSQENDSE